MYCKRGVGLNQSGTVKVNDYASVLAMKEMRLNSGQIDFCRDGALALSREMIK